MVLGRSDLDSGLLLCAQGSISLYQDSSQVLNSDVHRFACGMIGLEEPSDK